MLPWQTYESQRGCEILEVDDFGHAIGSLHELHHNKMLHWSFHDGAREMKACTMLAIDRAFHNHDLQPHLKTTLQHSTEATYAATQECILTMVLSTMISQIEPPHGLTIALEPIIDCGMAPSSERQSLNLKDLLLSSRAMHEHHWASRSEHDTRGRTFMRANLLNPTFNNGPEPTQTWSTDPATSDPDLS